MVEATTTSICRCKIIDNKIAVCTLHEHAETLLATCQYVRIFLKGLTPAEQKDQNMLREIILPYLDSQIAAADSYARGCVMREHSSISASIRSCKSALFRCGHA
jgi:hypothetical protein